MKKQNIIIMTSTLLFLALPIISAYSYGYLNSPLDFFDNEWIRFGIIFILLFSMIFFAVHKTFKNQGISAGIALGVSLLISIAIAQRGLLYSYAGDQIGDIALLIGIVVIIVALFKVLTSNIPNPWGWIMGIFSSILFLGLIDIQEIFPDYFYFGPLQTILDIIDGNLEKFLFVLGVIVLFFFLTRKQNGERTQQRANAKSEIIYHK